MLTGLPIVSSLPTRSGQTRFEDLRYYPAKDGVYRFCVEQDDDEYYVSVTEASSEELGFIDSIFLGSKEREQKKAAQ